MMRLIQAFSQVASISVLAFASTALLAEEQSSSRLNAQEQAVGASISWTSIEAIDSIGTLGGCDAKQIGEYAKSVVRLSTPVAKSCTVLALERSLTITDEIRSKIDRGDFYNDRSGCTAWRIADSLFATAWHCLPEQEYSCRYATIQFGYMGQQGETPDIWFEEECEEIVYSNQGLDFAVFRVTKKNYAPGDQGSWGTLPILPVISSPSDAFPGSTGVFFERRGFRRLDRIAILHHPLLSARCQAELKTLSPVSDFQLGLKASFFNSSDRQCRLIPRDDSTSPSWPSGRYPYFEGACNDVGNGRVASRKGFSGPATSILHGCDTCEGSSGAPVFSLEKNVLRGCSVIGTHTGSAKQLSLSEGNFARGNNLAVRMSVVAECIDFEATRRAGDEVVLKQENSIGRPECFAEIPSNSFGLDCREDLSPKCISWRQGE